MAIVILGMDLGKNSCSVAGLDEGASVVLRRRLRRENVVACAARPDPCGVAMEACCGARHMAGQLGDVRWRRRGTRSG